MTGIPVTKMYFYHDNMVFRRSCCWLSMSTRTESSEGTKTTRSVETDDFDIECKTFNDKIRNLDNEHQRLEKFTTTGTSTLAPADRKTMTRIVRRQSTICRETIRGNGTRLVPPVKVWSPRTTGIISVGSEVTPNIFRWKTMHWTVVFGSFSA